MAIQRSVPGIDYVRGDDYWTKYPDLPFGARVAKVNQHILASLRDSTSADVLCEWVPCQGSFVADLYDICLLLDRRFFHVILTAPMLALRSRKRERDGNEDLYPEVAAVTDYQRKRGCLLFDTEQEDISRIADEISKRILTNHELRTTD